ncbi:preprotein translocase subunit SecY [Candidatus Peregrinibacteria bacterium]|nr:preprotein translocase subunit SecY [Candidatus Peregrinibacteria bacterium]
MFKYLQQIWNSKDLRKKIIFTIGILIIYRLCTQISIPGANLEAVKMAVSKSQLLGVFSALTGGSMENLSILLMGLSPYINASIIIQLLTVIVPKFESLSKEGEQGRRKLNQYTRWLTVPIAFLQSYGMIILINAQVQLPILQGIENPAVIIPIMLTVTAGTVFLMWLGELISEHGIGNGISMIIFTGIIANIPMAIASSLAQTQFDPTSIVPFVLMILITLILLVIVILVTEGQRKIPIIYAGRGVRGKSDHAELPIRVNQAGMIPIIFGVSMASFPGLLAQLFQHSESPALKAIGDAILTYFSINSIGYVIIYFLLIIAFTYFYVSITFNPEQVAENLQKRGGYIPGIRPGKETSDHLGKVSNRLCLWGGVFIAFIAVAPMITGSLFSTLGIGSVSLLISGAGMIIIIGVVLELMRQINAQLVMHDYSKFY